jgi:hypothetical protein
MLDECDEIKGYAKGIDTLSKGYRYPTGKGKGKEIGKGISKEEEKENEILPFESADFALFWDNWNQHLREKKKPLKPTARKQQLSKLRDMGEERAIAALKHSMANNWQGIFEPDIRPNKINYSKTTYADRHPTDPEANQSHEDFLK